MLQTGLLGDIRIQRGDDRKGGMEIEGERGEGWSGEALCRREGQVRALWFYSLTSDLLCCVAGEPLD